MAFLGYSLAVLPHRVAEERCEVPVSEVSEGFVETKGPCCPNTYSSLSSRRYYQEEAMIPMVEAPYFEPLGFVRSVSAALRPGAAVLQEVDSEADSLEEFCQNPYIHLAITPLASFPSLAAPTPLHQSLRPHTICRPF